MRLGALVVGALIAGLLLLGVPRPASAQYGGVVRCESRDYRDNYCPVNTRGGVRLLRQTSRADCFEGETWGFDRRGIWVTQGCAADFEVGGGGRGPDYGQGRYERGGDWYDDRGRGGDYPDRGGQRIFCESRDFRYNYCPVRVSYDVDLVFQQSKSECRFNRSWGWDRGGIWVDRGCAAEFVVR
jgi:hypothetical protein